jgi:hypothetical protein
MPGTLLALADAPHLDQFHGVPLHVDQFPDHGFVEETVHQRSDVPFVLGRHHQVAQPILHKGRSDVLQTKIAPLRTQVATDDAAIGRQRLVGDLFGFLFLLLLDQESVQDAAERDPLPGELPSFAISRGLSRIGWPCWKPMPPRCPVGLREPILRSKRGWKN